jgi:hypothetical protein
MYEKTEYLIEGVAPLLMHNGQLADPLNPMSKELKRVSGKKKKTEDDYAEMSRIEWYAGLYLNAEGQVVVPGEALERMLIDAAKKSRLGREFTSAIIVDGAWPLIYEGPKELAAMFASGKFTDRRSVKVSTSRVMRTRPIFRTWKLKFEVNFLKKVIDQRQLDEAISIAGQLIGLGDYRPRYGRFAVCG